MSSAQVHIVWLSAPKAEIEARYVSRGLWSQGRRLNHDTRCMIMAAEHFVELAGKPAKEAGIAFATHVGSQESYAAFHKSIVNGSPQPMHYAASVPNTAASALSIRYALHGPSVTLSNTGPTALVAVETALDWVQDGLCDYALCGVLHAARRNTDLSHCAILGVSMQNADLIRSAFAPRSDHADAFDCFMACAKRLPTSVTLIEACHV